MISGTTAEENKREYYYLSGRRRDVVSSRWNPTAEQLRALEELYVRGTRTPTADQIQQITAHLRRCGRVEAKNVFYWFQNHKARERHKHRRKQLTLIREETKSWASHDAKSSTHTEKTSRQASAKLGETECKTDDREESERSKTLYQMDATWHAIHLSAATASDGEARTLQLFPLGEELSDAAVDVDAAASCEATTPFQYFEFLPERN